VPDISERRIMTPTGWYWLTGVSAEQLDAKVADGFRVFDLEVDQTSPPLHRARGQLGRARGRLVVVLQQDRRPALVAPHPARRLHQGPRGPLQQRRKALQRRAGAKARRQGVVVYSQLRFDEIADKLRDHDARLIDLDAYEHAGERWFSVVMVRNAGADATPWWYYSNLAATEIKAKLQEHSARITDIELRSHGASGPTFTVILEPDAGTTWWWYYGATRTEIDEYAAQHGARVIDAERYRAPDGSTRFAAVLLRNTNALTERMRRLLAAARSGGAFGLRLKEVGGPVLASLQSDRPFYPASSIKVVQHVHAMRRVDAGAITLASPVTKYEDPAECCGVTHAGHTPSIETLGQALRSMMEQSDNQSTNAIQERFGAGSAALGRAAMNQTSASLGFSPQTVLHHKFGCGGPANDPANSATLSDLTRLYESTATGALSAGAREDFDELMLNGTAYLDSVINQEAAAVGVSAATRDAFKARVASTAKGGSWTTGAGVSYRSLAGKVVLPLHPLRVTRTYVFGVFIDGADQLNSDFGLWDTGAELLRDAIRAALESYTK
jgi:hypothetical protein